MSRLTKVIDNKLGKTLTYAYNALGNRKQMIHPEGNVLDYAWDDANRLDRIVRDGKVEAGCDSGSEVPGSRMRPEPSAA